MTIQQVALAIARFYAVLNLTLGAGFLIFWLLAWSIPAYLNNISPNLGHYGTLSFHQGAVYAFSGVLLLLFGRPLSRFMAQP